MADEVEGPQESITAQPLDPGPVPEWLVIPDWAEGKAAATWLRMWIIPEALRRGYKAVWLRASAEQRYYLPPVFLTPDPQLPRLPVLDSRGPTSEGAVKLIDIDWNALPEANPGHFLLDAVEARWGTQNAVLFNEEVDASEEPSGDLLELLERVSAQYPGGRVLGHRVILADGTELENAPDDLKEALEKNRGRDYGFMRWRLAAGQQYIHNTLAEEVAEGFIELPQPPRRLRPTDAAKLLPLDKNLQLWTQTHLTSMVLDVTTSKAEDWLHIPKMNGYALDTQHGTALLENIGTMDNLRRILDMLGPEGLQYTLATLAHIGDVTQRKYGSLPESITGINPIKIVVTDLLRTMGRKPDGNTFSREQQLRPRHFLKAQSMVDYADIQPTKSGRSKLGIGPLIHVLNTELETTLPFDDMPDPGEVVSIIVMPGEAVFQLMRKGIRWCHPQLLRYHPLKRKYEIAIGFYVQQLAVNRRNKPGQEYVAIGSIDRGSGVESQDRNVSRRLMRIEEALNRLAEDGVIPGAPTPGGSHKAIFLDETTIADPIERARARKVKVVDSEALPNGYVPLPAGAARGTGYE